MKKLKVSWSILLLLLPFCGVAQGVVQDTTEKQEIEVDHADFLEFQQMDTSTIQKLVGHVELSQDSVFMYCDSATIKNRIDLVAKGQVVIQQNDTLNVFSDSLIYDGAKRVADLYGDVVLVNGEQQLFTKQLNYDLNTKIATYTTKSTLTNGSSQLTSKRGYYYVNEKAAYFKDSVIVVDTNFTLKADTLKFNTASKVVEFLGPTLIKNDSIKVYCESGYYDTENNVAEFTENAQFEKNGQQAQAAIIRYDGSNKEYLLIGDAQFREGTQQATADTIRHDEAADVTYLIGNAKFQDGEQNIDAQTIVYDAKTETYSTKGRSRISNPPQILEADQVDFVEATGLGLAIGNVIWQDTASQVTIICDNADINQNTNYLKASGGPKGRPLFISLIDEDSLFMAADTLMSLTIDSTSSDSSRLLIGYYDVRIYKSNLQAICDSLVYNTQDSLFFFYDDPIMWSDTSQFSADTMTMQLANNTIDRIFLRDNGLIVNSPDEFFFNQIQGKDITAIFDGENLRRMDVEGNAESVYYALDDDKAYVGVNKTICSEMILYFGNNQVDRIKFFEQPQGNFYPMQDADHEAMKLEGFYWETTRRPMQVEDLFMHRPTTVPTPLPEPIEPIGKASPALKSLPEKAKNKF